MRSPVHFETNKNSIVNEMELEEDSGLEVMAQAFERGLQHTATKQPHNSQNEFSRKTNHMLLERRRRRDLRDLFESLKQTLFADYQSTLLHQSYPVNSKPSSSYARSHSKWEILDAANREIDALLLRREVLLSARNNLIKELSNKK